jgi:hypothetical protein
MLSVTCRGNGVVFLASTALMRGMSDVLEINVFDS